MDTDTPKLNPIRIMRERNKPVARGHASWDGRKTLCGITLNHYEFGEELPPASNPIEFVDQVTDRCAKCLRHVRIIIAMTKLVDRQVKIGGPTK